MKPKAAIQRLKPLLKASSFTSEQAKAYKVSSAVLAYYVKIGELVRFARGVYGGINSPGIKDFRWEDLIQAISQVKQGVICLTSALALYQLTEEIPRQHWIAIPNSTRHRSNNSVKIIRLRNIKLGKIYIELDGNKLPIFDRERTIVDAFSYLGKETALKALRVTLIKKGKEKIDLEKIRQYAKILRVKIEPYLLVLSL
jgi:predicted transcriptional regulator of viral defense system